MRLLRLYTELLCRSIVLRKVLIRYFIFTDTLPILHQRLVSSHGHVSAGRTFDFIVLGKFRDSIEAHCLIDRLYNLSSHTMP